MAVRFNSMDDFREKFQLLRNDSDVFGLLLFDDRPSHRAAELFSEETFPWIDRLAVATKMFFFVWLRKSDWGFVENPGLEIAALFHIAPRELPGIVLLTLDAAKQDVGSCAYLALDPSLFENDRAHVEEVLADLFSVIQHCRQGSSVGLGSCIEAQVARLRAQEQRRPLIQYLRATAAAIKTFPIELVKALSEAFAKGMTRSLTGGE